ncbi:MAG: hypothetical protein KC613_20445, partial [Myxococcales bacterium]|nr:hypothetical protein [Myxococcales bacterium]
MRRVGWIALCACLGLHGCADDEDLSASADGGLPLPPADFAVAGPEGGPPDGGCRVGTTRPCGDLCPGVRHCVDGVYGPCEPPPELCNGRDDDC